MPTVVASPYLASHRFRHAGGREQAPTTRNGSLQSVEPLRAIVARQLSLWPFGTRVAHLYLLVDPLGGDPALVQGLLRAMEHEYFRSETRSQTNALRCVILAAHFVLRSRNSDRLSHERVTAAVACAVTRGSTLYVALAGETAALAWDGALPYVHRGRGRAARPLGGDALPLVTFGSAPYAPGTRVALLCGPAWQDDSVDRAIQVMREGDPTSAQEQLSVLFAGHDRLARVLVADAPKGVGRTPAPPPDAPEAPVASSNPRLYPPARRSRAVRSTRVAAATILAVGAVAAGAMVGRLRAAPNAVTPPETPLHAKSAVVVARPRHLVTLPRGESMVTDLTFGDGQLYFLDLDAGAVRALAPDRDAGSIDEAPPVARAGAAVGRRRLDAPVAAAWVPGRNGRDGSLAVVDRTRLLVEVDPATRTMRAAGIDGTDWKAIDGVTANADALYLLDRMSRRVFTYDRGPDGSLLAGVSARVTPLAGSTGREVVAQSDVFVRDDAGAIQRIGPDGQVRPFRVVPPNGALGRVTAISGDGAGGVFLADPTHARVAHVSADGAWLGEIRTADGTTLRHVANLAAAPDGQRVFAVTESAVIALDIPGP